MSIPAKSSYPLISCSSLTGKELSYPVKVKSRSISSDERQLVGMSSRVAVLLTAYSEAVARVSVTVVVVHVVRRERVTVLIRIPWLWCAGGRNGISKRGRATSLEPPQPSVESHDRMRKGNGKAERLVVFVVWHSELLIERMIKIEWKVFG
jgi:hypothetical protein